MKNFFLSLFFSILIISCGGKRTDSLSNGLPDRVISGVFDVQVGGLEYGVYTLSKGNFDNIEKIIEVKNLYKIRPDKQFFKLDPISKLSDLNGNFLIIRLQEKTVLKLQLKNVNKSVNIEQDEDQMIDNIDSNFFHLDIDSYMFPWTKAKRYIEIFNKTKTFKNPYKKYFYFYELFWKIREDIRFYNASCECSLGNCPSNGSFAGLKFYELYVIFIDILEKHNEVLDNLFFEVDNMILKWEGLVTNDNKTEFLNGMKALYSDYGNVISLLFRVGDISRLRTDYPKAMSPFVAPASAFPVPRKLINIGRRFKRLEKVISNYDGKDKIKDIFMWLKSLSKKYSELNEMEKFFDFDDIELARKDMFYKENSKQLFNIYSTVSSWLSNNIKIKSKYPNLKIIKYNYSCSQ